MKIALIQSKQNDLYCFADPQRRFDVKEAKELQQAMVRQNLHLLRQAAEEGNDLLVTAEAINFAGQPRRFDGNYAELIRSTQDELLSELSAIAKAGNCYVVAGMYKAEGYQLYNTAHLFDRQGNVQAVYRKTHLAGEENDYLTPGHELIVAHTDLGQLGLAVCWDMQFPETCQALADAGAELILAPTWGWEWLYGPARAYENGVFVAAAMGIPWECDIEGVRSPSQVIGPDGTILAEGSRTAPEIVSCGLPPLSSCHELREMRKSCRRGILPVMNR